MTTPIASIPVSPSRHGNAWQNDLHRNGNDDGVSQRIGYLESGPRRSLLPRFLDAKVGKAIDSTRSERVANFAILRASHLGTFAGSPSSGEKSVRNRYAAPVFSGRILTIIMNDFWIVRDPPPMAAKVQPVLGQNCKTQNETDQVQPLPERTWKEYFGQTARKAGLGAAMMGAGLGLSGFGGLEDKRADAGIMMNADTPPSYYEQQGERFAGAFTGTSGGTMGLKLVYNRPGVNGLITRLVPAILVNERQFGASGHTVSDIMQFNPVITAFLGKDANNPDRVSGVISFELHPDYVASGFNGLTTPDVLRGILASPFTGSLPLTFASAIPAAGTTVSWAGYGFQATPAGVQLGQSGKLTGGQVVLSGQPPIGGSDPAINHRTVTSQAIFGHYNPYFSDSNSRLVNDNFETFGMFTRAGLDPASGYGEYLDLTIGSAGHSFMTAVPEPSALLLLLAGGGLVAGARRFLRKTNKPGTPGNAG